MLIIPKLYPGEEYAGIILGKGPASDYHLILLPDEIGNVNWSEAKLWAESIIGRDLPTRREQALLYANLKDQFQPDWYWSGEQHASDADYAWYQFFHDGYQYGIDKSAELRARAVRREVIK